MKPTILYEDGDVLAIDKPSGLVVHSDGLPAQAGKTKEETLVDWLIEKYPEMENVGEPVRVEAGSKKHDKRSGERIFRPGIVHRLDRETSGVMLVAKNQKSFENLKRQFQNHEIVKKYEAFVFGRVKNNEGKIDRPIGRSSSDFRKWSAQRGARGEMREAQTDYRVISKNNEYSFLEIIPKTGRTHQIRVHMKAINYPLVGDSLYAPKKENSLGFERTALHSREVTFTGLDSTKHKVEAPYPEDFSRAIKLLQN